MALIQTEKCENANLDSMGMSMFIERQSKALVEK